MELNLFHGRKTPDEQLDDWGFNGPLIQGIQDISWTYGNLRLHFKDEASWIEARNQTGWEGMGDWSLDVAQEEDLIVTKDGYFGDYHLSNPKQENPIQASDLFATPESMDALMANGELYAGGEKMAFMMGMMLTWNYLAAQMEEWVKCQNSN